MWFIGVVVEQETSAPAPKKTGSAPDLNHTGVSTIQSIRPEKQRYMVRLEGYAYPLYTTKWGLGKE